MANSIGINTSSLQLMNAADPHTAMGLCAFLASCDQRYGKMPLSRAMNEIYAAVSHKQYAIVATMMEAAPLPGTGSQQLKSPPRLVPVGYVLWANLNYVSAALYAKGLRELSPSEFKSGSMRWLIQICTPYGDQEAIWNFFKKQLDLEPTNDPIYTLDFLENFSHTIIRKADGSVPGRS